MLSFDKLKKQDSIYRIRIILFFFFFILPYIVAVVGGLNDNTDRLLVAAAMQCSIAAVGRALKLRIKDTPPDYLEHFKE